jgi:hypothetical protein
MPWEPAEPRGPRIVAAIWLAVFPPSFFAFAATVAESAVRACCASGTIPAATRTPAERHEQRQR